MKNYDRLLIYILISFLGFLSCEEQEINLTDTAPYFTMQFINARKLQTLNDSIDNIDDKIITINDSITVLDSLYELNQTDYSVEKESLNNTKSDLNTLKGLFNDTISTVESGDVLISKIVAASLEGTEVTYADSAKSYKLGLNPNADSSKFYVHLNNNVYTIRTKYSRLTAEENRKIKVLAYDFDLLFDSNLDGYDSLSKIQDDSTNLSSNDFKAIIYF